MSLGNFALGSTVRIPLQILEDGVPSENVDSAVIKKIIKPDLSSDSDFPKDMTLIDKSYSIYYLDYIPEDKGSYIVVFSVTISGSSFSQIDTFFISSASGTSSSSSIPTAKPSYVIMSSKPESVSASNSSSSETLSSSGAKTVSSSSSDSSSSEESSGEESSEKFRPSAKGL
tara:strand:- start:207 stop:722 length:516 start_codon:yes stop_codon:yes gene_type:complete